jgi:DNA-binding NarL/FixJ family response regulator
MRKVIMNQYNNLTQTQKSIVDLFLNGYLSSKGISQKLNISPSTVDVRACKQFRLGSHYSANETELNCE